MAIEPAPCMPLPSAQHLMPFSLPRRTCACHAFCAASAGARTSYKSVIGLQYSDAITRNREVLPTDFLEGMFCDNFTARCDAAGRTWQRAHAQDNLM